MTDKNRTIANESLAPALRIQSRAAVYIVFAVSGAAALVYQILWARWLSLLFGSTTPSVTIVLSSFMLGLALGSWYVGRILERIKRPMIVYAWIEVGIGLFAVFFPVFTQIVDELFVAVVDVESAVWFNYSVKAVLACALLAVPTTLMGATLPLLTEFFRGSTTGEGGTWKVGLLYAANTIGAAIGAMMASFVMIELIGTRNTTLLAAGLNFIVAVLAFQIGKGVEKGKKSKQSAPLPLDGMGKIAIGVLTAGGGLAMASEVLWTRMLETIVGNSSYAFALILVVYLIGLAVGSWLMSLWVSRLKGLPAWLAGTQLAIGLWTVTAIMFYDRLNNWLASGTKVPITTIIADYGKAALVLFPLALFSGAAFPIATRILDRDLEDAAGRRIARAYAWNTVGAMVGALIAGFLIAPRFDFFESLYFLSTLSALTALVAVSVMMWVGLGGRVRVVAIVLATGAIGLGGYGFGQSFGSSQFKNKLAQRAPKWNIEYHQPGLQGITTALTHRGDDRASTLLVNGAGMTIKHTITKMMAHLPMFAHPDPQNTLVICFGMGTTYRSAISHGGQATVVELVDEVYEAFDVFFDDGDRVRGYEKGRMITNDGRNFLKLTRERFDVITIDPPPPIDAAGVNNLYSKDFIELARDHLAEGGIMAHWIPLPGAQAGVGDEYSLNMLKRTFTEVFPYSYELLSDPVAGYHVLGSMQPIELSSASVRRRLQDASVRLDFYEWHSVALDWFDSLTPIDRRTLRKETIMVTDDRPHLEFFLLRKLRAGATKSHRTDLMHRK